jgi:hypothetical protein
MGIRDRLRSAMTGAVKFEINKNRTPEEKIRDLESQIKAKKTQKEMQDQFKAKKSELFNLNHPKLSSGYQMSRSFLVEKAKERAAFIRQNNPAAIQKRRNYGTKQAK